MSLSEFTKFTIPSFWRNTNSKANPSAIGKAIIKSSDEELSQFSNGSDDRLQDGTLITGLKGGPIFIISNGERREIQTKSLFNDLGFKEENIIKISDDAIIVHPLGFPLEKGF